MKPIFVHMYEKEIMKRKAEFREMILLEANELEKSHENEILDSL
jgi:hypothetical protein